MVTTLDHDRCKVFYRNTLSGTILNDSQQVVELKKDLNRPPVIKKEEDAEATPSHRLDAALNVNQGLVELGHPHPKPGAEL